MGIDDHFSTWAALFIRSCNDSELGTAPAPTTPGIQYVGVTPAACELLRTVDAGGVPTFVTNNLKQIAADNGIDVTIQWSPNEIVEAIREKASIEESAPPAPSD